MTGCRVFDAVRVGRARGGIVVGWIGLQGGAGGSTTSHTLGLGYV
jgi:hypothetical protein